MNYRYVFTCVILVFLFLFSENNYSQSIKRQSIGSYGSAGRAENIIIRQTVGQPYFTAAYSSSQVGINPGFQQPVSYRKITGDKFPGLFQLDVYPNPASSSFIIESPGGIENVLVKILDIHGRIIYEDKVSALYSYTVDCARWDSGIYLLFVSTSDKKHHTISKIIINK